MGLVQKATEGGSGEPSSIAKPTPQAEIKEEVQSPKKKIVEMEVDKNVKKEELGKKRKMEESSTSSEEEEDDEEEDDDDEDDEES